MTFDDLKTHVDKLQSLLSDQQPGIVSWCQFVANEWKSIVSLWDNGESIDRKDKQINEQDWTLEDNINQDAIDSFVKLCKDINRYDDIKYLLNKIGLYKVIVRRDNIRYTISDVGIEERCCIINISNIKEILCNEIAISINQDVLSFIDELPESIKPIFENNHTELIKFK